MQDPHRLALWPPNSTQCHLPQFKSNSNSFYQQTLEPLVAWLEKRYKGTNDKIERMLQEQKISYNALWFLFNTGKKVWGTDAGLLIAGEVKTAKYMRGFFPGLLITAKVRNVPRRLCRVCLCLCVLCVCVCVV
jgi:hypothetical protein